MAFAPVSPLTIDGLNKFLSMTYHQTITYAIYTFADLRVADQLIHAPPDRGFTVEEIIGNDRKQWDSQLLYRILRTCVYGGIVQSVNDDKHFILTSSGMMLTSDHPSRVRDHVVYVLGYVPTNAFLQLSDMVRGEGTGTGIARISGGLDLYTFLSQPEQKDFLTTFSGAMATFSIQTGTAIVDGVDFSRFKTIVDLGGNSGTFSAQILHAYSSIQHGIVFDLPHVIDQYNDGKEFTSRQISKDRWSFISGDMYNSSTVPLADAYLLKYILHNYSDEKCVEILSSICQANKNKKDSTTTIFIVEHIILPDGALSNWQSHGFDIVMAALFEDARERIEDEYKDLLQKSGFEFKKLYPLEAPESVIEAILVQ